MSVEITAIASLLGILGKGVVEKVDEIIRQRLREKGAERGLEQVTATDMVQNIEIALSKAEETIGSAGIET